MLWMMRKQAPTLAFLVTEFDGGSNCYLLNTESCLLLPPVLAPGEGQGNSD